MNQNTRNLIEWTIQKIEDRVLLRCPDFQNAALVHSTPKFVLFVFKKEQIILLLSCNPAPSLIRCYPFVASSGTLGPKRTEGDLQIPEGFYRPLWLNPQSKFYLSVKLNYPNDFDNAAAKFYGIVHLGSDIFIHGPDRSQGCISISNEAIEEIFWLIHKAGIGKFDVIIAPSNRLHSKGFEGLENYPAFYDEMYKSLYTKVAELWELGIFPLST
jgi:hypothetical protein